MVALRRALEEDTLDNTNDTAVDTAPDTKPEGVNGELADAVEWLKAAGVVSADGKPTFSGFFEELVEPQTKRVVTELSRAYEPKSHASNDD